MCWRECEDKQTKENAIFIIYFAVIDCFFSHFWLQTTDKTTDDNNNLTINVSPSGRHRNDYQFSFVRTHMYSVTCVESFYGKKMHSFHSDYYCKMLFIISVGFFFKFSQQKKKKQKMFVHILLILVHRSSNACLMFTFS